MLNTVSEITGLSFLKEQLRRFCSKIRQEAEWTLVLQGVTDPLVVGNIDCRAKLDFTSFKNCSHIDTLVKLKIHHGEQQSLRKSQTF